MGTVGAVMTLSETLRPRCCKMRDTLGKKHQPCPTGLACSPSPDLVGQNESVSDLEASLVENLGMSQMVPPRIL